MEKEEEEEVLQKIKKIDFFGELLMIFGRNKLIVKEPPNGSKHVTLKIRKDGIIDVQGVSKKSKNKTGKRY